MAWLLAVTAFALYALTSGHLVGYEGETAATSRGLVEHGTLQVLPGNGLTQEGIPGRGGRRFSRTGITQPVLEAPFYLVGAGLDAVSSDGGSLRWRRIALELFDPAMAALTVLAAFALLRLREVPLRRAALAAVLIAVASLVWPYAKIGMDTTLMAMVAATMAAAAAAARRPHFGRWWVSTGILAALALAAKPYGVLLLAGVVPLVWPPLRSLERRRAAVLGLLVPIAIGVALTGWYNAYRTGSVTNFLHPNPLDVGHAPFNLLGLLASPGRGLIFYSPLVVLGSLALRRGWRNDPALSLAIVVPVALNLIAISATYVWTDDTWGPRYLVPTVWLLLLPIVWLPRADLRRRRVSLLVGVSVLVQLLGVFAPFGAAKLAARQLTGVAVWPTDVSPNQFIPYGGDGPRWVPELSAIWINGELFAAWVKRQVTGSGFSVTYAPTWGTAHRLDLSDPGRAVHARLPDVWWRDPGQDAGTLGLVALLGIAVIGGTVGLGRALRAGDDHAPVSRRIRPLASRA